MFQWHIDRNNKPECQKCKTAVKIILKKHFLLGLVISFGFHVVNKLILKWAVNKNVLTYHCFAYLCCNNNVNVNT